MFFAAIFLDRFCLVLQNPFFWVSTWFFLSILVFWEFLQLNTLSGHLKPNFIWGFYSSLHVIFMPLMSPRRKRMGEFLCWSFFTGNEGTPNKEISKIGENNKLGDAPASLYTKHEIFKNGQHHKLGDAPASPYANNTSVCKHFSLVFWAT